MAQAEAGMELAAVLDAAGGDSACSRAIVALARAAAELAAVIERPRIAGRLGSVTGGANADGDAQRELDLIAETLCRSALEAAGVGPYLSEETEGEVRLDPEGRIAVAIDPLDGSSNIDVNGVIGTIFSILPADPAAPAQDAFRQPGHAQLAAGFFMYGPQTLLLLTLGAGTDVFARDPQSGAFVLVEKGLVIPGEAGEYSINASNARHWTAPVRRYIEHCLLGSEGPSGRVHNMRWAGSLVADAYRIFLRGGVFLYPGDARRGYERGRLRLLYEAAPIAFLAEQAGGAATDGERPILDAVAERPHERIPLVMGSASKVEAVRRYHLEAATPEAAQA